MSTTIPTVFKYQRNPTFASWLWSLWLHFPNRVRCSFYKLVLSLFATYAVEGVSPTVKKLPFGIYAKFSQVPDEALAMEFVRERTTIPVPTVLDQVWNPSWSGASVKMPLPGDIYRPWLTLMTALPGRPLFTQGQQSRLALCTVEQRTKMAKVLCRWINQLRSIPPPDPQKVSGFLGGSLFSHRIDLIRRVGPFSDPAEFHAQPFCTAYPNDDDEKLKKLVKDRPRKHYRICLTHGDLLPHNILADEDFNLTGIIDWETAGWMPEYWERASSWRSFFSHWYGWVDMVPIAFPEYDDDMALEANIQLTYDA